MNTKDISFAHSVSGYAEQIASDHLLVKKEDSFSSRFSKLTVGMVSFAFIGLIGTIETIFRYGVASLFYLCHFCLPTTLSDTFRMKILAPTQKSAESTKAATMNSFKKIVTNFEI